MTNLIPTIIVCQVSFISHILNTKDFTQVFSIFPLQTQERPDKPIALSRNTHKTLVARATTQSKQNCLRFIRHCMSGSNLQFVSINSQDFRKFCKVRISQLTSPFLRSIVRNNSSISRGIKSNALNPKVFTRFLNVNHVTLRSFPTNTMIYSTRHDVHIVSKAVFEFTHKHE